ncbi:NPCBM/NEW2 domain-containing protein [Sphingomonas sp.]|uniref:NPCBM/NEW2 domain-containing protein n=1 Tax=Sphingomonas sp. TaxID=28214 RepID=UPI0025FEB530|nr:NPCBM/NEW2 domain-containing protein [Sphingomonas sp.]
MKRAAFAALLAASSLALASPAAAQSDPLAPTGQWSVYSGGAAQLPPMGWNSWNAFALDISEAKLLGSAEAIVDSGLAAKGYRYINIDEGWWARRDADGRLVIRTDKFPSARQTGGRTSFRALTDKLHAMGLKAGIYSDIGRNSCGQIHSDDKANLPSGTVAEREVGLYGHVDQDIGLYFGEWGFDLIKVDACGIRGLPADAPKVVSGEFRALPPLVDSGSLGRTNIAGTKALYTQVARALERANPDNDFIFSLCLWGAADVRSWAREIASTSRTSEDIFPIWGRMLHNMDTALRRPLYAHPGSWNDPDMLYIGAGDFDARHLTEARSHFSLWAMLNAPLIIGYDLRTAAPELMAILGKPEVIALNQDPAGNQAVLAYDSDDVDILVKTLANGEKAVAVLNRTSEPVSATLTAAHLKFAADADIALTDLWSGEARRFRDRQELKLAPHETLLFRVKGSRLLADGHYLSEMPGSVNPAVDGVVAPEVDPLVHRAILPWAGTRVTREGPRYGGWGGAQADSTPYSEQLGIAGRRFDTGIGVLANSRLEVRNAGYRRFTALVGVDDSARDRSQPVTFEVYADGRLVTRSRPMRFGEAPAPLAADVAGAKLVELVARTPGAPRFPDPVTWAEAALRR